MSIANRTFPSVTFHRFRIPVSIFFPPLLSLYFISPSVSSPFPRVFVPFFLSSPPFFPFPLGFFSFSFPYPFLRTHPSVFTPPSPPIPPSVPPLPLPLLLSVYQQIPGFIPDSIPTAVSTFMNSWSPYLWRYPAHFFDLFFSFLLFSNCAQTTLVSSSRIFSFSSKYSLAHVRWEIN
jgi:hypothetical protein